MKNTIYLLLLAMCCGFAGCKKDSVVKTAPTGLNGKTNNSGPQGANGVTDDTGIGLPGTVGDATVKTVTINQGDWVKEGVTGYGVIARTTSSTILQGCLIYLDYTQYQTGHKAEGDQYIALPYFNGNDKFDIITELASGTNVVIIQYKNLSDYTKRPPQALTFKVITFSAISLDDVKARAGSLEFNDVARYYKIR